MEILPKKVTDADSFLQVLADEAHQLTLESRSPRTVKVYMTYYNAFVNFCAARGFQAEPVTWEAMVAYMADCSLNNKPLARVVTTLSAVRHFHTVCGLPVDALKDSRVIRALEGYKRRWARRKKRIAGADPVTVGDIKRMVSNIPISLMGFRDRAMILLGFSAALRRSELVAIEVCDLDFTDKGMLLHIPVSKTDQYGYGENVAVPYVDSEFCAVTAVETWLNASGIKSGPIFRPINPHTYEIEDRAMSPEQFVYIFNYIVANAGINKDRLRRISPHSLRAGLVTEQVNAGASIPEVMMVTRHKSPEMVVRYWKETDKFKHSHLGSIFNDDAEK